MWAAIQFFSRSARIAADSSRAALLSTAKFLSPLVAS
jgi:hypothetical protein